MGYITIDVETMRASGVIYAHLGSGNENVSSHAFSNYNLNSGLPLLSGNANIVGDKLATDDALPNLTLNLSDKKLSITRTAAMADIHSALDSTNSYKRVALS